MLWAVLTDFTVSVFTLLLGVLEVVRLRLIEPDNKLPSDSSYISSRGVDGNGTLAALEFVGVGDVRLPTDSATTPIEFKDEFDLDSGCRSLDITELRDSDDARLGGVKLVDGVLVFKEEGIERAKT